MIINDWQKTIQDITDTLNLSEIAEEFISFREERRKFWIIYVAE